MLFALLLACTDAPPPEPQTEEPDPVFAFSPLTEGPVVALSEGGAPERTPVALPEAVTLIGAEGDRALLRSHTDRSRLLILDLSTGKLVGEASNVDGLDWDGGRVSSRGALISLTDGSQVTPAVTTPAGPAASVRTLLGEGKVFVVATDAEGDSWYGPWDDPSSAAVSVSSRLESPGRRLGWDHKGRPETWNARGVPGDSGDCVRWRLDGPTPRCVAVADPTPTAQRLELTAGWSAVDAWGEPVVLYRDSQPIPWALEPTDCDWTLTAAMADPPRVLAECQASRDEPVRQRRLWSPDGEVGWQQSLPPSQRGMFRTRLVRSPILIESIPGTEPPLAVRWVDLEAMRGWSSAPLAPLVRDSIPEPALARDPHTGAVSLLDLEAGVQHVLTEAAEDCPVDLIELMRAGDWVVLSCRQQVQREVYEFQQHYAQLIDLKGRRSWRIEAMIEAVLEDGVVLVSDRERDVAEGAVPFAALEVWELGGESDIPQNQ